MKLMLQIAFGVFLGTLGAQLVVDICHTRQDQRAKQLADQRNAEQEKVRREQGERIRALLLQGQQSKSLGGAKAPHGFIPDDAAQP
ncbi:MAG: hypothetical protein M0R33_16925 [Methylomonas sp.]|jgi:uncharacterized protein YdbL (DUF1318 family)|uniref:hypothetical protein n=1 Tax=Methylomonas sp. TaxID=418 RepID=UPI0025CBD4EE|nr:hypothetical protein [Methylomonas sp.]MCK9608129.1 hypothetical protein [Methylomonas sp.]